MVDDWVNHVFQRLGEVVGVLYIDTCKAFDLVDHNLLLEKMKMYKFHEDSLAWFASYLSDRRQCVKVNKPLSDEQPINQGVPQGSTLGPLSFLLSVNDLPLQDAIRNLNLSADYATVSAHGTDINTVETQLQTKLHNIANWCIDNSMVLGINKTRLYAVGNSPKA